MALHFDEHIGIYFVRLINNYHYFINCFVCLTLYFVCGKVFVTKNLYIFSSYNSVASKADNFFDDRDMSDLNDEKIIIGSDKKCLIVENS